MKQKLEKGCTGPSSLERTGACLSDQNHVGSGFACLWFACGSLKRPKWRRSRNAHLRARLWLAWATWLKKILGN